jgi:hypothetical protein
MRAPERLWQKVQHIELEQVVSLPQLCHRGTFTMDDVTAQISDARGRALGAPEVVVRQCWKDHVIDFYRPRPKRRRPATRDC